MNTQQKSHKSLGSSVKYMNGKWKFINSLPIFSLGVTIKKDFESNGCDVLKWLTKKDELKTYMVMCFAHDYGLTELKWTRGKSRELMKEAGIQYSVSGWISTPILTAVYIYDKYRELFYGEK